MSTITAATSLIAAIFVARASAVDSFRPQIPKTWDETEINSVEIPVGHQNSTSLSNQQLRFTAEPISIE